MRFSLIAAALSLASFTSALPALSTESESATLIKRAGPSGELVEPAGGLYWRVGDKLHLNYKRTISPETYTDKINVVLKSFDGKVTYNANVITLASNLTYPARADAQYIEAWFTIPPLTNARDPTQNSFACGLEITEQQGGSVGSTIAPFLAAAPRLYISTV